MAGNITVINKIINAKIASIDTVIRTANTPALIFSQIDFHIYHLE